MESIMFFTAILIFAVIAKDTTSQESTVIVISFCSVINSILLFWVCFSLSMRIQIDYEKRELYIRHPYLIRKINFEEILSIQIIDYNKVSFDFIISTKKTSKKLSFSKYYKKKNTEKRISIINELKQDLMNISNKNY
jgi:Na+/melibiose symporter-like transporter